MVQGKWISFKEAEFKGKTKLFFVFAKNDNSLIGQVKWYAPWRQYGFFPGPGTVYERQCLLDITRFIQNLMNERKLQRKLLKK